MVKRFNFFKEAGFVLLLLLIIIFALFPFVQMLSTSLKYQWDWGNPSLIPKQINTKAYAEVLGIGRQNAKVPASIQKLLANAKNLSPEAKKKILEQYQSSGDVFPFLTYFRNSLLLSFFAALFSVMIAIMGAYSFSRLRYRGRALIRRSVLFVYMFGGILLIIPLYRISTGLGLLSTEIGTFLSLMVIYIVQTLPVALFMLGNYFRSIPFSIEEAALIEGYGRFSILWRIIVPLAFPAIITVFVYAFMIAWNEYLFASVFLKSYQGIYTLPIGLKSLFYSKNAIWDRIMAASMLTATPVVVLFLAVERRLVSGLSAGGVKE